MDARERQRAERVTDALVKRRAAEMDEESQESQGNIVVGIFWGLVATLLIAGGLFLAVWLWEAMDRETAGRLVFFGLCVGFVLKTAWRRGK